MSSLNLYDKRQLEKLFDMSSGYVLNFSDVTFGDFFVDIANIDIYSGKYKSSGTSKAKKLREFWKLEPDYLVGKVLIALVEHAESFALDTTNMALVDQCRIVANRLLGVCSSNPI